MERIRELSQRVRSLLDQVSMERELSAPLRGAGWSVQLLDEIARVFDADFIVSAHLLNPASVPTEGWKWGDYAIGGPIARRDDARALAAQWYSDPEVSDPIDELFVRGVSAMKFLCSESTDRAQWEASKHVTYYMDRLGLGFELGSWVRATGPDRAGAHNLAALLSKGRTPWTQNECDLFHMMHLGLCWQIESPPTCAQPEPDAEEPARAALACSLDSLSSHPRAADLTPSERGVLVHLLEGATEAQVAERLSRSPHTIHRHVKSIYEKLDVSNRVELVRAFL